MRMLGDPPPVPFAETVPDLDVPARVVLGVDEERGALVPGQVHRFSPAADGGDQHFVAVAMSVMRQGRRPS
ncbi:hypothetical protein [Streptomyces sp. NPDC096033]|uniref:hypothetical protein n=1 Tax=Streptomyces sp. NPDC096033 TaxID=3366071 RepID=UPI0038061661